MNARQKNQTASLCRRMTTATPTLSIFCPPDTPRAASKAELVAGKLEQLPAATSPEAAEEIAASLFAILEADEIEAGAKRLKIRRK